ncbi:hypothetical protein [Escherichia coli]|uniref:hypothetical protein n=1 Tax=Escherichia coli TaxID=562 RepID=UPI001CF19FF2|nr:hypothetical protein [Escherichia coli]MCA8543623.1 hypothetical protein [Escherichia coli]MCA8562025.1 hypothetical protein [Escherichia coli]MCA8570957.1 hypothetical protein [Escherichia coli]MCA8580301.1 hypothetical protein [Escherichia coli]MCA8585064.1 hypothetical protein [Escherichia coli]
MRTRIDYLADKYSFTERNESPRLRRQWQDVLEECRLTEAGPEERLRIALLNVDYVTSFELPFRLLLTRTPQLIAALREEWGLSQKNVVFNDKRFGCVYSLKASLSGVLQLPALDIWTAFKKIDQSQVVYEEAVLRSRVSERNMQVSQNGRVYPSYGGNVDGTVANAATRLASGARNILGSIAACTAFDSVR